MRQQSCTSTGRTRLTSKLFFPERVSHPAEMFATVPIADSYYIFNGEINLIISSATLLMYDAAITFDMEICYIWRRKFNLASYIFVLNRYLGILVAVMSILTNFTSQDSNVVINYLWILAKGMTILITYVFFVIRIWAVWNYCWSTLVFLIPPALVYVVTVMYLLVMTRFVFIPGKNNISISGGGCEWSWHGSKSSQGGYISMLWVGILVITGSLIKTFGTWRAARKVGIKSPITSLIIRDVICMSILADLVLDFKQAYGVDVIGSLGMTFATIAVSRFILDLRSMDDAAPSDEVRDISFTSSLRAQTIDFSRTINLSQIRDSTEHDSDSLA
ncbi:hypothetical protein C8Q75DRAFT_772933 [Abortiporus biennis]|nr:hypothetical protein C8Q75DRAFT_772933 [Abortiporus biennis]